MPLMVTYGLEEPFTMWVDADKVQKVVMNLLSNSLKFTPSGGKVSLAFDVISRADAATRFPLTAADTDGQYACISVSDTGPGIPEDQLGRIFEPYHTTKAKGNGLGLMIVQRIVRDHGGHIEVSSKEGEGTCFRVLLPRAEKRVRKIADRG